MATAKKLPSGSWRVRAYAGKDHNGKNIYKSFTAPTKKEAEYMAAQYVNFERELIEADTDSFGAIANKYLSSKSNVLSPTTIDGYKRIRKNYLADWETIKVSDITNSRIQAKVNELSETKSPKTVHNVYGFITAVLYDANPNRKITVSLPKKKKIIKTLPPAQDIINAVKGTDVELPVLLAMWLSLRMSEVRGMKKSDIYDGYLIIRNVKLQTSEGDKLREVTKTYDSTRMLKLPPYIASLIAKVETDFLVSDSISMVEKKFSKALEKAGVPHIRFHDLRHLNASVMLSLGISDKYAMERGGWSSTNILKSVYQHTLTPERLAADTKIDDYFNKLVNGEDGGPADGSNENS